MTKPRRLQRTRKITAVLGSACALPALFALVVVASPSLLAQQSSNTQNEPQADYVIHQEVRRVILDVVVTDKSGKPVLNLSRQDFSVLENGVSQPVRSFEPHDLVHVSQAVLPKLPALPVNTFVNVPTVQERGPLYVLVYDMVDTNTEDQPHARQQIKDFLASKPAGSRFALFVWAKGLRLVQGFTSDTSELLQAFDTNRKSGHIPNIFLLGDNFGKGDFTAPFDVMTFIAQYLQGMPGRKVMIWMSTGLPSSIPGLMTLESVDTQANLQQAQGFTGVDAGVLPGATRRMVDAMTNARVSLYTIGLHGLDPGTHGMDRTSDAVARATGGRGFSNSASNDIKSVLENITEEGSNYYEISYAPANSNYDGKRRAIQVKLAKKGYTLSYRRLYYADDPSVPIVDKDEAKALQQQADRPVATKRGDTLFAYMEHGAPQAHDILLRAQVATVGGMMKATPEQMANLIEQPAYFKVHSKEKPAKLPPPIPLQTYVIDYTVLDAEFQSRAKSSMTAPPQLEFAAAAYDVDGTMLNGIAQFATAQTGPRDATTKPLFRVRQTVDVPAGAAWLRLAVHDPITNHIGTMEIPLPLAAENAHAEVANPQKQK